MRDLVDREDRVGAVEGAACADHVHLCLRIPPKYAVRKVVGRLKGRSSIILHEGRPEWRRQDAVGARVLRQHRRPGRGEGQGVHQEAGGGGRFE